MGKTVKKSSVVGKSKGKSATDKLKGESTRGITKSTKLQKKKVDAVQRKTVKDKSSKASEDTACSSSKNQVLYLFRLELNIVFLSLCICSVYGICSVLL
jgi:hypothetical protein